MKTLEIDLYNRAGRESITNEDSETKSKFHIKFDSCRLRNFRRNCKFT